MVLVFITISVMGESLQEKEVTLTQEERFEMLFGKAMVNLRTLSESRPSRLQRNTRVEETQRKLVKTALTVEEKYELLFGRAMTQNRISRTSRLGCDGVKRANLYLSMKY